MNVREMVAAQLKAMDADGLWSPDRTCRCDIGDPMSCGARGCQECVAAKWVHYQNGIKHNGKPDMYVRWEPMGDVEREKEKT